MICTVTVAEAVLLFLTSTLLDSPTLTPMSWFTVALAAQATVAGAMGLPVGEMLRVPPAAFFPDYAPVIDDATVETLGITSADDAMVLVVVNPGDQAGDLRPGMHLNMLGADGPGKAEATVGAVASCALFCDEWEQASHGGELTGAVEAGVVTRERVTDLGAVLVQPRRWQPVLRGAVGEGDRVAHAGHGMALRADLDHRVQADLGGEGHPGVDGVDRPARHPGGDDVPEPLVLGPGGQPLHQQRPESVPVGGAVLVAGEPGVVDQLRRMRIAHS